MASNGTTTIIQGLLLNAAWVNAVTLTSLVLSMVVNTLVTGLIVFKILKVFLEVRATVTSTERTSASTWDTRLRYIIFVVIESGMALFAIQLVRVVLYAVQTVQSDYAYPLVICINQMINVIIRSVHFYFFFFTDNIYLVRESHQQ